MRSVSLSSSLAVGLIILTLVGHCYGNIHVGYYRGKCGKYDIEKIIFEVVKHKFMKDTDTVSDLIRLQFHDCTIRGCDASILLDGPNAEKTANPNLSLRGFDVLDDVKDSVEKVCPGVLSCADALIIASRCSVFLAGGKWYEVETGRRDSLVSLKSEALAQLPSVNMPIRDAIHLFNRMGLSREDFVVLLGGHTLGTTHCDKFQDRLYNFRNSGKPDRRMNYALLRELRQTCPKNARFNNETFLDHTPNSHFVLDNAYYKQILANKGILEIDANMAYSPLTNRIVRKMAFTPGYFHEQFGPAMVKLGRAGVLTGTQGEIRKSCRRTNH